ncbi:hypothetical protein OQA88_9258 [Cercophora sp. LCS_1]
MQPPKVTRDDTEMHSPLAMAATIDGASPALGPTDPAMELDEESILKGLTENVRDQDDLERDITLQANQALIEAEDKRDQKRIEKAEQTRSKLEGQLRLQKQKLRAAAANPTSRLRIQQDITRIEAEIDLCGKDIADFKTRIGQRHKEGATDELPTAAGGKLPNETHREYLIRTGKITPFAQIGGPRPSDAEGKLADAILDAEDEAVAEELAEKAADGPRSHQNLRLPGFAEESEYTGAVESEFSLRPRKKRKARRSGDSEDDYVPEDTTRTGTPASYASDGSDDVDLTDLSPKPKRKKTSKESDAKVDLSNIDDGNEAVYQNRLRDWVERRSRARRIRQERLGQQVDAGDGVEEWFKPSPDQPDHEFDNGLKLPGDIFPSLFDYQKTGVQWLAELYAQQTGGIIGDEMGLGKTVQLISFVAALHYSKMLDKPVIVVAPATVLRQWVNEFHRWWPPLRVSILHSSGSGMFNVRSEGEIEDFEDAWDGERKSSKSSPAAKKIVDRVVKHGHVLVTTYAGLQTYGDVLIPVKWGYAVLDEGHKIRNPNTAITIYCKELQTPNRVILSGTPMQNNLTELWSLFDFIYPMRLGTLVSFRNQFEVPIKLGGYANATNLQIMTAQKCAETLKETISPYLLQRLKVDVAADLPKKSEQVIFCKLTQPQREAYERFLKSSEMTAILNRTRQSLYGIDILRKICNHPDLLDPLLKNDPEYQWGSSSKSGKMAVVKSLLPLWKRLGHKTLLFCQGVQMLDIIEAFIRRQDNLTFIRMDGKTPVKQRQTLVDQFNNDPDLDIFLLTTKVGGLGVNLTGANRVIIFDPDWNPSTDMQARERAWRLGQKREVTVFRLMTAGTIEEKIYHRQIFKQFLSNKVLKDPKQQTNFNIHDLHDLFTLSSYEDGVTETSEIFKGSEVKGFKPAGPRELVLPGHDIDPRKGLQPATEDAHKPSVKKEDLDTIEGVAAVEVYEDGTAPPPNEEDRLMEGIFSKSVHSALEHDQIINGKKVVKADRQMLQREANRIAAEAAIALRRAGEAARAVPIGTVTWTGAFGEAGRPVNNRRGRGGPSSTGILRGVADRQGFAPATASASASSSRSATPAPGPVRNPRTKDFEKMIPAFIKRHGGQVPSKLLVDHFNQYCGSSRQAAEFKLALETVAVMEKRGSSMRAIWSLRDEYK